MRRYVICCGDFFWRPNSCGYTYSLCEAGTYSEAEAKMIENNRRAPADVAVPLDEAIEQIRPNLEILESLLARHRK